MLSMVTEDERKKNAERYQKNRKRILAQSAERRRLYPEKKKLADKKYRESHKEESKKYGKKYHKNNREKISQQRKEYRKSHKEEIKIKTKEKYWKTHTPYITKWEKLGITKKEYKKLEDKKYNESHKEEIKQKSHERYLKNQDKVKAKVKKYRLENKEKIYWRKRKYRENNREKERERKRKYARENKEKINEYKRKYRATYPELKLAADIRHLTKLGFPNKLSPHAYQHALTAWSKTVKKLGHGLCLVCNNPAAVAHHIIHKSKYPGLSLNVSNGIPLCDICFISSL